MTIEELWEELSPVVINLGERLIGAIMVLLIGRLIIRLVLRAVKKSKLFKRADVTVSRFLINALRILLNVVLIVSIIGILGVPMTSVITVIASAGVAVGLALQGALGNLAGSIMLLIFRPYHLEDYVEIDGVGGTVKDIGLFYTTLETPDKKTVTLPNGNVMNENITNYSVSKTRRVDMEFSVSYGTDVEKMKRLLVDVASEHSLVLKDPAPFARLKKQNNSSLDFVLRVWVNGADYWTVHFDLLEQVHARLCEEGIEIPFAQMDVHVKKEL